MKPSASASGSAIELKPDAAAYRQLGDLLHAAAATIECASMLSPLAPAWRSMARAQVCTPASGGRSIAWAAWRERSKVSDALWRSIPRTKVTALSWRRHWSEQACWTRLSCSLSGQRPKLTRQGARARGAVVFLGNYAADLPAAEVTRQAALYGEALAHREAGKLHLAHTNAR